MLEFDDFNYHRKHLPEDQGKFFKDLAEQFRQEIIHSPKVAAYLEQFRKQDRDYFIRTYIETKIEIIRNYDLYNDEYRDVEEYEFIFHRRAKMALHAILQKKLFNVQLKWRAGQLKFDSNPADLNTPGLDVCMDFYFWQNHIASCPFIEPVTEFEKEIMKEYLLTEVNGDLDVFDPYVQWQDYYLVTDRDEDGFFEDMPDWYEFYDLRTGTGSLLILPDLKGEKESFYYRLARAEQVSGNASYEEEYDKPGLFGYGQDIIDFARKFETDKYVRQLFRGYEARYRRTNRLVTPEDIEYAIDELASADRKVTFPAHLNWDEAIVYAAGKYRNTKTAEFLDAVYEEYLMRIELGMAATEPYAKLVEEYSKFGPAKKIILEARVKNGEPADFNY